MKPSAMHPFQEGLAAGRLMIQRCALCEAWQSPERARCLGCGGSRLDWQEASGRATVYAVTEVHRAPTESFQALVPYTIVLARLEEGPLVMGHAEPGLAIDTAIVAGYQPHAEGWLLRFTAASASTALPGAPPVARSAAGGPTSTSSPHSATPPGQPT